MTLETVLLILLAVLRITLALGVIGIIAFCCMIVVLVAYAWGWDRVLYGLGWQQLDTCQRPDGSTVTRPESGCGDPSCKDPNCNYGSGPNRDPLPCPERGLV